MTINNKLLPLYAAMAPFVVWPIEYFMPFPYIVEELVKVLLVKNAQSFKMAIIIGAMFAFSESIFFLTPLIAQGSFALILVRLLITGALHTLTSIAYFKQGWKALIWTIPLHFGYNLWLVNKY